MKNIVLLLCMIATSGILQGQTMKWVPIQNGSSLGQCTCASGAKEKCYILEYKPAVSGTLTSYTTGFLISCTSKGSSLVKNESCTMTNNANEINGCTETGQVLFNSSGNSGTPLNNKIEAGKPVYLHQVCFNIPAGESITVQEEELTDLTTSIDLGNGDVKTERPAFVTQTIGIAIKPRPDAARPTVYLDFKTIPVGEFISQLDWSVVADAPVSSFTVEYSIDGSQFTDIGEVKGNETISANGYQFLHHQAIAGVNFYRLKMINQEGRYEYSPVRLVNFSTGNFTAKAWPSPADDLLNVFVGDAGQPGQFELVDLSGKSISRTDFDKGNSNHQVKVDQLAPGVYTMVVVSGTNRTTEKIVINH